MAEAPRVADADELIDEILAKKGPHQYSQGLSESNWEEELEQIPLFMTKPPEVVDPMKAPALAALQDLKYQEGSPESRAIAYKEDGNESFKIKQYREAVLAYTEGIQQQSVDRQLNAILYSNRAAAQYRLGNYRSCIADATQARTYNPGYLKAIVKGVEANLRLDKFTEALEWCDSGLKVEPSHVRLKQLRAESLQEKKRINRDQRKRQARKKQQLKEDERLVEAINSRGILLQESCAPGDDKDEDDDDDDEGEVAATLAMLMIRGPHASSCQPVHLDPSGHLVWPVLLLYPEHSQSDLIQAFREEERFCEHLEIVFMEVAPWDTEHQYSLTTVELYYEDMAAGEYVAVDPSSSLSAVLSSGRYTVVGGLPTFLVLVKGSVYWRQFLSRTTLT